MVYHGNIFLGRDEKTYGKEGTGTVDYDPDFECGGPPGTPDRQCAFETTDDHASGLQVNGREGRNMQVNIASYRDPLCPKTLYNLFTKAKVPEKLFVRVLQQRDPEVDVDCLEEYCVMMAKDRGEDPTGDELIESCPYSSQVFIHEIHAKEAAGPTWARGLLSKDIEAAHQTGDLKPQDHCMSLDSHMDVEPEWDDKMVKMWEDAVNEYAVLSTYVQDIEHLGEDGNGKKHREVPHLCMVKFTSQVRTHATKCAKDLSKPKLTNAVWGAGLSFSKCHAELKVMVDPYTPHVFDGEEFNRAARFWTYGYDIYTPNHVYVLHDYHRSQSNPIMHTWYQNGKKHGNINDSNKRLKTMLDMPGGFGDTEPEKAIEMKRSKFGLGDRRSLDQLIQFSGIDLRNEKVTIDGKNRCGNIQWVPFKEHPLGVNYIPNFDNVTENPKDLPYESTSIWFTADIKKDDDGGLPKENLSEKHAELQDALEGEVIAESDLSKMHAELEEELKEEELVKNNIDVKHENLELENEEIDGEADDAEVMLKHKADERKEADDGRTEKADDGEEADNGEVKKSDDGEKAGDDASINRGRKDKESTEDVEVKQGAVEKLKAGPLRGAAFLKGKEYVANHPLVGPGEHGFNHLPMFVKCNVSLLVFGVIFVIMKTSGTGRAFKINSKKRNT